MKAFRCDIRLPFVVFLMTCCGLTNQETIDGRFIAKHGLNVSAVGLITTSVMTRTTPRCASFCQMHPTCVGVNYRKTDDGSPNCNLLATSDDVVVRLDATFYEKGKYTCEDS